ncbi:MAG: hemerythrin domain-containing protein [Betaproteobacteria bacterium]|nr:hemerythrin domain-containing protein [Betaproteobacteria bacterium]MBI2960313.1 hemerythrin domain-containing protein [Betaproteobacteria bacterium]
MKADLAAVWHAEHDNFARLLDLLEREVAAFRLGEQPNYDLMLDIVYYLRDYPDQVHHRQEDVAFARLLERDPKMKPQIDRLLQEHRVIAAAGSALLRHLDEVVADALEPRSIVEAAAATYLTYFREHLAAEDEQVIPRAAELLTPEDWAAAAAAVRPRPDPLFGEDIEARYRNLRRKIALGAQGA